MGRRGPLIACTVTAFVAAGMWGGLASAERGRQGRVVRVERPKAIATDEVQLCGIDTTGANTDEPRLMCFGDAPRIGAIVEFVDDAGYRGSGRVVRSEPGLSFFGQCQEQSGHTVFFEWTTSANDHAGHYGASLAGVIGVKLDRRRARLLSSPDRRPPEAVSSPIAIGLDANGDDSADLVVLGRECRDRAPAYAGGGSRRGTALCFDYWLYARAKWKLVNQAVLYSCF